jgi:exodeoxyribonuclease VII large subunit
VTSLDGAAIRDIIKVLRRRSPNAQIVIRPARVQGEGAALDIARGLRAITRVRGVDVVIVGRGGGSIEDLWAFNEEVVARAIANCAVPVISAVGHETDTTIADFVADRRAPTPSAAAEIVVAAKDEFIGRIDALQKRLRASARARMQTIGRRLHGLEVRPAFAGVPARVAMRGRQASELTFALAHVMRSRLALRERRLGQIRRQLETLDLGRRLAGIRTRLVSADGRLSGAIARRRHRADAQLRDSAGRLASLSPLAVLGRGYAVAWNDDRTRVLRDASETIVGDRIRVTLAKGELKCEVQTKSTNTEDTDKNGGTRLH